MLDDSCAVTPFRVREGVKFPSIEILFKTRKWHIKADTEQQNHAWFRAIYNRIIALSYIRRCEMSKQIVDQRVVEFLDNTTYVRVE